MKKKKKGFSMIELLFVMVIIATLSAVAIPSFKSEASTLTSMKSDARNTIAFLENIKVINGDYSIIIDDSYQDTTGNGLSDNSIGNESIPLSPGNRMSIYI